MIDLYTTSLRSKILLGFTVILMIMFLAMLWSVYNFFRFNEYIKKTMQDNYHLIIAADNMGKALDEQVVAVIQMYNQSFEVGEKQFEKADFDFFYWNQRAREYAYSTEEMSLLDSMKIEYDIFKEENINSIDYKIFLRREVKKTKVDLGNIILKLQHIKGRCNKILEINHVFLNKAVEDVKTITQTAAITILLILLGAIFIGFVFASKFSDYVVRPISKLKTSVTHIADGHFEERIEISESADEINALAEEFNKMSEKLQSYEQINVKKILYEKRKSELVIEGMNEPVLMVDEYYNVLFANKSFYENFGEQTRKKSDIKKILKADKSNRYLKERSEKQNIKDDTISITDKNGGIVYFKIISASLDIPESNRKGTVYVFNDITKYEELDRMKSEFIAKVSHELKTPLTSLGMALGLFEDEILGKISDKQKDLIVSMQEDYDRLNKLVYEILELTKLEANIGKIKFQKFEASKLAEHINKKLAIQAKEKSIALNVVDLAKGIQINGNLDSMLSAIENLVTNSIRFTPNDGQIDVEFLVNDDDLVIKIADTGIGISPDNLKKVFDKFIQIDNSAPGSLGLGLSIAKEIIEIHGGDIKAFSELGKGSTFEIKLPVA